MKYSAGLIERERAKARQKKHGGTAPGKAKDESLPENLPEVSEGDARKLAASQLGISHATADKMESVVDAIDEAEPERIAAQGGTGPHCALREMRFKWHDRPKPCNAAHRS